MLSTLRLLLRAGYKAFLSPTKSLVSYSQYAEDIIIYNLLKSLKKNKNGIFVDVGSHHPRRGSNTYFFYKLGWRGLLIDLEKDKVLAAKLSRPRDKVILAAVSSEKKKVDIYSQKYFSTNTTIRKDTIDSSYKKTSTVITKTLQEILQENKIPKNFEILSIDVEGEDLDVLLGLSLKHYCPLVICVESWESRNGIKSLLESPLHHHLSKNNYNLIGWSGLSVIYLTHEFNPAKKILQK